MFTQSMIPEDLDLAEIVASPSDYGDDKIIQLIHHRTGWGRSMLLSSMEDGLKVALGLAEKPKAKPKADPKKTDTPKVIAPTKD